MKNKPTRAVFVTFSPAFGKCFESLFVSSFEVEFVISDEDPVVVEDSVVGGSEVVGGSVVVPINVFFIVNLFPF